ncbi:MAG TPA: c-type cytochrome [Burkholderiaceae bacterium]|nr:c-type cytochrome [Burkholderiaceae bacterium]
MNRGSFVLLIALGALGFGRAACAQADTERGRREFESSCAVCHGVEARGDGPLRPFLIKRPPDLTTLARRRGGTFPAQDVMEMIDGRSSVQLGSHGTREMPVWGQVYLESAQDEAGRSKLHPEWSVRDRIMALVDYLAGLQR